jgi:cysteine desulfurase
MTETTVYLDNNASTPVDPRVLDAMLPLLTEHYANPSSVHAFGSAAAARVEEARAQVAARIGARDSEIVFTSGGTEADNAALRGVLAARPERRHLVISAVEHPAVLDTAEQLEREGVRVTRVGVNEAGRLDLDALRDQVGDDTALVSIMLANNETGVLHPLRDVVTIAHARGALVHTDAVQAVGKSDVDVGALGVDLLSLSAHKLHGPKGAGALYVRRGTPLAPLLWGGPHERHRRGGTLNAPGIVGLGVACAICLTENDPEAHRIRALRDRLEREVRARCPGAHVIGAERERVGNTSCICFAGTQAEAVLLVLSEAGIYASSGAACSSGSLEPSHVLTAMGIEPRVGQGQIRFSLSRFSTDAHVDRLMQVLPDALRRVGAVSA